MADVGAPSACNENRPGRTMPSVVSPLNGSAPSFAQVLNNSLGAGILQARLRVGARRCAGDIALARCGNERPIIGTIHGGCKTLAAG